MAEKNFKAVVLTLCLAMGLTLAAGCHDDDEEDFEGPVAVMKIAHLDTDRDGTPDTYQYLIRIADEADSDLADESPQVLLPDGTALPAGCNAGPDLIVCETAFQTPPGAGTKADILPGPYQVFNSDEGIMEFIVDALDLAGGDPAFADVASLNPATPGNLADPAVLDWDTTTPGEAGDYWEFRVINSDGADDDGGSVRGRAGDWASSDFSIDLPDTWDVGDALVVEINAVSNIGRGDYLQTLVEEVVATGYTLN